MASLGTSNSQLQKYEFRGEIVEALVEESGRGAYGAVKKVKFGGLICGVKVLHDVLRGELSSGDPLSRAPEWFERECEILSQLRHPNIVLFLGSGVTYENDTTVPIIVMEYLPHTLWDCIEDKIHPLPEQVKYSILRDVALGLRYLHSCDYIHRDLTASNVLLTPNMTGKIADLGSARNPYIGPSRMTPAPGNPAYMPPEALLGMYDRKKIKKIDIFSFGVLILHTFTGELPVPSQSNGNSVMRREKYFQKMGDKCSLTSLTKSLLNDKPDCRPCVDEVLQGIETNTPEFPPDPDFYNRVTMMNTIELMRAEIDTLHKQIEEEKKDKDEQINNLYKQMEVLKDVYGKKDKDKEELIEKERRDFHQQIESLKMRRDDQTPPTSSVTTSASSIPSQPRVIDPRGCKPGDKLNCTQCTRLPHGMYDATAVVLGNAVYVGGGNAGEMSDCICKYAIEEDTWYLLPHCPVTHFGLAKLAGRVIVVGGILTGPRKQARRTSVQPDDISSKCFTLDDKSRYWQSSCPPMPTPRYSLTAMEYQSCLVTCGGRTAKAVVDTVEIFQLHSGESGEWYVTHPLPSPYYGMSYAIIQDSCYLLGGESGPHLGTCKVLYASLTSLIQASMLGSFLHEFQSMNPWHELQEDIPSTRSTAASLGNSLLAVGGNSRKPKIRCYQHATNSWFVLADLPDLNARVGPAVAELPTGELLIIGGATSNLDPQSTVHKGTLSSKS